VLLICFASALAVAAYGSIYVPGRFISFVGIPVCIMTVIIVSAISNGVMTHGEPRLSARLSEERREKDGLFLRIVSKLKPVKVPSQLADIFETYLVVLLLFVIVSAALFILYSAATGQLLPSIGLRA
jgi:cell division protein FtsL